MTMKNSQHTENERSPLEVPQQFVTELFDELLEDDSLHNNLSVDDLHAFRISKEDSQTRGHGHIIIVGEPRQIQLVPAALQPTELSRVYDITYLEIGDGSLQRYQPTPSWVCRDREQTYRRALDIYIDEERDLGADGKTPFRRFSDRFGSWFRNTTGKKSPDRSYVASLMPLKTTREASSDGSVEKQVIWTDR